MFLQDTLKVFSEAHDNEKALVTYSKQWEQHILHLSQLHKMLKKIQSLGEETIAKEDLLGGESIGNLLSYIYYRFKNGDHGVVLHQGS